MIYIIFNSLLIKGVKILDFDSFIFTDDISPSFNEESLCFLISHNFKHFEFISQTVAINKLLSIQASLGEL